MVKYSNKLPKKNVFLNILLDIIKSSAGTRNVVGVKPKLDRSKLVVGARVALDQNTQTIMQVLPR